MGTWKERQTERRRGRGRRRRRRRRRRDQDVWEEKVGNDWLVGGDQVYVGGRFKTSMPPKLHGGSG
jgi:hypothetical protein